MASKLAYVRRCGGVVVARAPTVGAAAASAAYWWRCGGAVAKHRGAAARAVWSYGGAVVARVAADGPSLRGFRAGAAGSGSVLPHLLATSAHRRALTCPQPHQQSQFTLSFTTE